MATNPTQTKGPYIGIDFGTTKTMVAEFDPAKRFPKVRKLGRQSDEMPTSMYVAEDGQVLFGDYADDEGGHDCLGYIRRFKMDLGKTTKRPFGRQLVKPVHLTERFLADLRTRLESEVCHRPVELAVITVPATFGPAQRKDLEQAASGAGFQEVVLLSEPEAAGLAYCEQNTDLSSKQRFLVADWGGGTFDLAVLERDEYGNSRVLGHYVDGLSGIGGEDLDDLFWDVAPRLLAGFPPLDRQPRQHWARYRRHITEIKKSLSVKPETTAGFVLENGDFVRRSVTRSELETIIGEKVLEGAGRVADLVKRCRADKCDLDYILLAGGTSLIPMIPLKFEQAAGLKCRRWAEGRDAIALGAAIHAFRVFGEEAAATPSQRPVAMDPNGKMAAMSRYRDLVEDSWIGNRISDEKRSFLAIKKAELGLTDPEARSIEIQVTGQYLPDGALSLGTRTTTQSTGNVLKIGIEKSDVVMQVYAFDPQAHVDLDWNQFVSESHFPVDYLLTIENTSGRELHSLRVSLEAADGRRHSILIQSISPGKDGTLYFSTVGLEGWFITAGDVVTVDGHGFGPEIFKITEAACARVSKNQRVRDEVPCFVILRKATFSSNYVLKLLNITTEMIRVVSVESTAGNLSSPIEIPLGGEAEIGWCELSGGRNLVPGDEFYISIQGYRGIHGVIAEGQAKKGGAWKVLAALGGIALAAAGAG